MVSREARRVMIRRTVLFRGSCGPHFAFCIFCTFSQHPRTHLHIGPESAGIPGDGSDGIVLLSATARPHPRACTRGLLGAFRAPHGVACVGCGRHPSVLDIMLKPP